MGMDLTEVFSQNRESRNGFLHFLTSSFNEISVSEQLLPILLEKYITIPKSNILHFLLC